MVFSSTVFLFIFLPIVFLLHWIAPFRWKNALLLIASLLFYAWGEPVIIVVMLFSIAANKILALRIAKGRTPNGKKRLLGIAIALNLLPLVVFKYANFIVENLNALLPFDINVPQIHLPIGISFFTFQSMSYVIDVYRGRVKPQPRLSKVALYISLFPQLIAGPIVKYRDIHAQIDHRVMTVESVALGIRRFIVGLSKKLLIANVMGEVADQIFASNAVGLLNLPTAWVGAIAYSLQIYFDFSGYSDMAIGLGLMFGFRILENFRHPYASTNIRDFWRRWHISLTNWFRDYLYYPLGGSRRGLNRTCLNMGIIFLCTAVWHGAAWTFVLWGLFHAAFMILETRSWIRPVQWRFRVLARLYTLTVVVVGFAIFRAENIFQAVTYLGALFGGFQFGPAYMTNLGVMLSPLVLFTFVVAIIGSAPVLSYFRSRRFASNRVVMAVNLAGYIATMLLLVLCILKLSSATYNPFIYFRF